MRAASPPLQGNKSCWLRESSVVNPDRRWPPLLCVRVLRYPLEPATIVPKTCCPASVAMCRTLAAFPTSCLERAKEFKTRLGIFLHKSELGSDTGSVGKLEWGNKHSKEGKNFSEDVLGWKESFDLLLSSKNGVAAFHAFLKTEFSEENLEFWLACEEFKKLRSATKLGSRAHRIFEEFICSEAPKEVNIDHETRELTRTNLQAATAVCFDAAQRKVRALMEKDSYPRFLKSPAYRDLATQATAASASPSSSSPAEPSHT
ncbi:regulator of G-protein signaling 16 isoform X2 [Bubalus kerabau]|uniref:regulator of G-protein signaling 16 isoform X2 n=1 Tax=Bubalus bubalis TaxID=89462 RepID=UPI001D103FCD|nr:regulator of G-protein signaling 16 isoform X2 [Bubalus bubalis]XP_055438855.1 regulator of G-protein signaling 16 isoform X2 [Bubalus carabanensis]